MENFSIPCWAEDDRPREKMALKGRSALSNTELLAILIGSGTRKKSAVDLAQEILNSVNNNLHALGKITLHDLCQFSGIGPAKAISILAALELARRRDQELPTETQKITSSKDAYQVLRPIFLDLYYEEFHIILLSRSNKIISIDLISKGGFNGTVVDCRMIFKKALDAKASYIVAAHNHPSGSLEPSKQDDIITKKLVEFGKLIEIQIIDHVIFTDHGYYSYADAGAL